jgi:hypothetical protein
LYGLTAVPVARRLHVTRPPRTRPLLVGGDGWVIELGQTLQSAGLDVLMWAGAEEERQQIRQAGLRLAPGELLASAAGSGAELEGVTAVLLLTEEDDFNALASTILQGTGGANVYRLGASLRDHGVVAPFTGADILFQQSLTRPALIRRHDDGASIIAYQPAETLPDGHDLLFLIRRDGRLEPVTETARPGFQAGDTAVLLGPSRQ